MQRRAVHFLLALLLVSSWRLTSLHAADKTISLPKPDLGRGKLFMRAVAERKSTREFRAGTLPAETLGNLLWVAFGINRPENAHRTAPSAMNSQEIDLYVVLPEAVYVYDATNHALKFVQSGDLRAAINGQPYGRDAAVMLLFVAEKSRMTRAKPETRSFYAAFDAGCICQNVYLFCASEGLGSVVFDLARAPVATALKLSDTQEIIMAQAVGLPKTINSANSEVPK